MGSEPDRRAGTALKAAGTERYGDRDSPLPAIFVMEKTLIYTTKRNVGDKFWVPRVYEDFKDEQIVVDGKTYQRCDDELVPQVKEKQIVEIVINITSTGVKEFYFVINSKDNVAPDMLRTHIEPDDKIFDNPEEALQFAVGWMNEHQKPYFG